MAGQPGTDEIRPAARPPGLTRRDLLWRGAAGAGLLAAGPVLSACSSGGTTTSSSSASASAGTPKRGGTLSFGRQTGPTQLDPANSIVEGDVYTLDKIFEPLYITVSSSLDIAVVQGWPGVGSVSRDQQRLHITATNAEALVRRLLAADEDLEELEVRRAGLAEVFTELTQETAR